MEDLALPTILQQMLVDIQNPECHYWLYNNYFDIQPPTDRQITRRWQAPLFRDYDRSGDPVNLECGVRRGWDALRCNSKK